ncbi:hypothetical protein LVJ94_13805 [Pendulispora rubella]|uniref:Uncharacterized protein n=1 Tax=Pendulispora rubella TaxID=2741070 RepID=A0ABZ2LGK5_9BACT
MNFSNYKFKSEIFKRQLAEALELAVGQEAAKVKARAVLAVLSARDVRVSSAVRARILSCLDLAVLDRWIHRAATASDAEDVLHE